MLLELYGLSSPLYIESKMELTLVGSETLLPFDENINNQWWIAAQKELRD